jgi:hypothetical protein
MLVEYYAKIRKAVVVVMAPVYFVSYARGDIEHPAFHEIFVGFVDDLKQRVSNKLPEMAADDVVFVDADIRLAQPDAPPGGWR